MDQHNIKTGKRNILTRISDRWSHRAQMGNATLGRQELDFLPAALEIKERPPHPATRVTAYALLSLFVIGIVWACVGEVDIVATAEGKIIPSGQVKQIQPYERGVVSNILVTDGQVVKAGDPLIELDRSQTEADQKRFEQEVLQNRLNQWRLTQFGDYLGSFSIEGANEFEPIPPNSRFPDLAKLLPSEYQKKQQLLLLSQQWQGYFSEQSRLNQLLNDKKAEKQVNEAGIAKLAGTLPLISQRVKALKQLMDKKMAAKVQYLVLEQERVEQQQDLRAARSRKLQLEAQVAELAQQKKALKAHTQTDNSQQLLKLDQDYLSLKEELKKAQDLNRKQLLVSPVDGMVQELAIHTVGGVVTPAQLLMKIVPENQKLEVEAWLENKDIGFIYPGQEVELKIHTFPFTKYGVINGRVESINADATLDENRGLIYKTQVLMDKSQLLVEGREVQLVPGMSVSAEIKTGKRYLIEYITAPLLRYKDESVNER